MNRERKRPNLWLRLSLLILSAAGLVVLMSRHTLASLQPQTPEAQTLTTSGVIQAEQVSIAGEFGGLIASIPVAKGDKVTAGQIVVQFDTTMLDAQIEVAQAMVDMAEAGLMQAKAGARPGQIAVARAQLAQAQAGLLAAQQAVSDTQMLLDNPQEIDLHIAVTKAQLESAKHQLAQATAIKDAVEVAKAQYDKAYAEFGGGGRRRVQVAQGSLDDLRKLLPDIPVELPEVPGSSYNYGDWELTFNDNGYTLYKWVNITFPLEAQQLPNRWWQTWVGVNAALTQTQGLEGKLADLSRQRAMPQALQNHVDEALSKKAQIEAQAALAQVQVEALEAGATPEQIAAIEARVNQARSGLAALQRQRAMLALKAPIDGIIVDVPMHPGEVAAAGATILTIADLNKLTLTVYVPQNQIGQIHLDETVQISVNSYPNRTFEGRISRIADRAEFTPRNVATQEERVNLVFAVEITIINHGGALKMGMPADVVIRLGER